MVNKPSEEFTLIFPLCHGRNLWIFLGLKEPRGPFVPHIKKPFWTGFGGKLNVGENPRDGAIRETKEELGFPPFEDSLRACADVQVVRFDSEFKEQKRAHIHVYSFLMSRHHIVPSQEYLEGRWFPYRSLPYNEMLQTDRWIGEIFRPNVTFSFVTVDALMDFSPLCISVENR
jgi:8-oxo-dGTP pyrophosphatase MutT (NUDIX family)